MRVYVNGCSHTEGTAVALPNIEDAYPYVLEKDYGIPTVTDASAGSSNDRIFRSTVERIVKDPNYTHALIQWSSPDRFETPGNPKSNPDVERSYGGFWQHHPASALSENRAHIDIPYRSFYRKFYNTKSQAVKRKCRNKMHSYMLALNSFLESYDIVPIHANHWPLPKLDTLLEKTVKSELRFLINPEVGLENTLLSNGYRFCMKPRGDGLGPDWHFMKDAHQQKAYWIHEYLKTGERVKTPEEIITWEHTTDPSYNVYNIGDL